jgi:NADPH:quinone reductase-like Zn-dependent oxidoreductase
VSAAPTCGATAASPSTAVDSIGHESIGVVESVGAEVTTLAVGDFGIALTPAARPVGDPEVHQASGRGSG